MYNYVYNFGGVDNLLIRPIFYTFVIKSLWASVLAYCTHKSQRTCGNDHQMELYFSDKEDMTGVAVLAIAIATI